MKHQPDGDSAEGRRSGEAVHPFQVVDRHPAGREREDKIRKGAIGYGPALGCVAIAFAIRLLLSPVLEADAPFLLFAPAVIAAGALAVSGRACLRPRRGTLRPPPGPIVLGEDFAHVMRYLFFAPMMCPVFTRMKHRFLVGFARVLEARAPLHNCRPLA